MEINPDVCPLCGHSAAAQFMEVFDHLVSRDSFTLKICTSCSFIYTNPIPAPDEIAKYYNSVDYMSHAGQRFNLSYLAYSSARYYMFHKKLRWLKMLNSANSSLLDYGCGTGSFLNFMLKKNWDAWGVEPNKSARDYASRKAGHRVYADLEPLLDREFNMITLWHVLEHLHDLNQTINRMLSCLSSPGWMVVAVPNCSSFDAQYYQAFWAGYDVPRHLSHFTPETMKVLAKKHRLRLIKTLPLKLDAYYICMLSEKYRQGSIARALQIAYKSNQAAKQNHSNYSSLVYILEK